MFCEAIQTRKQTRAMNAVFVKNTLQFISRVMFDDQALDFRRLQWLHRIRMYSEHACLSRDTSSDMTWYELADLLVLERVRAHVSNDELLVRICVNETVAIGLTLYGKISSDQRITCPIEQACR